MKELKINPEFQDLIPKLKQEEFDLLEESIIEEGCRDAIVIWNGTVIDGHNRYEICKKHNIEFDVTRKEFDSEEQVKDWIDANQLGRRNLTPDQMRYIRGRRYERLKKPKGGTGANQHVQIAQNGPSATAEKLAKEHGVSRNTIKRDSEFYKEVEELKKVRPEDAKKIISGEERAQPIIKEIKSQERKQQTTEEFKKRSEQFNISEDKVKIIHGDFYEETKSIKGNSIDCIITDPPYPKEFLPLWEQLSEVAERVLKPGGFCITYSGQLNLDKVMEALSKKLTYYWMFNLVHTGNTQLVNPRNVICTWKPIIIFQKPPFKKLEIVVSDEIKGSGREKELHNWQQGEGEVKEILDKFTKPNDLILDPFAGSGTVLASCYKNDRRCIGIELNEDDYNNIRGRLTDATEKTI